jgi:hypothetical protein
LAPHGGAIEVETSDQLDVFLSELANADIVANVLDVQGFWGRSQTFERLHVTAPSIHPPTLLPGAAPVDGKDRLRHGPAVAVRRRPARLREPPGGHPPGGRADREAKCLVAARIQDELETARGHREEIGFRIFDDAEAARVPGAAVARRPSAGAVVSPTTTGACTASTAAF